MIDTPIRKRDPLKLAAWLCRYANDIGIDPADEQQLKDAAVELRAWHDAKGRSEAENARLRAAMEVIATTECLCDDLMIGNKCEPCIARAALAASAPAGDTISKGPQP